MANANHTPGEWSGSKTITAPMPARPEGSYARYTVAQRINKRADADLICAAPELLEACEKARDVMNNTGAMVAGRLPDVSAGLHDAASRMQKAINKAKRE